VRHATASALTAYTLFAAMAIAVIVVDALR